MGMRIECCNPECGKPFTLGMGFLYPLYMERKGVVGIYFRPYCSLMCLTYAEPPADYI